MIEQSLANQSKDLITSAIISLKKQSSSIRQILTTKLDGESFFSIEELSKEVVLYSGTGSVIQTIGTVKRNIYDSIPHILACAYDNDLDLLGLVATDRQFYLYETQRRQGVLKIINFKDKISYGVWFLPKSSVWLTVSETHTITVWSISRKAICTVEVINIK